MDLLYSIFPGDVAQKLWQGHHVPARKFDDVTMLFSDIVGFTAVCAQCTPMQVISMLNELYTRFDYQCGVLDVYKVSASVERPENDLNYKMICFQGSFSSSSTTIQTHSAIKKKSIC